VDPGVRASQRVRSAEELVDTTSERVGEDDFGGSWFRSGLDELVDSVNADVVLTPPGAQVIEDWIVKLLTNRLQIEAWYRQRPDIADTAIDGPTLVVGLPRTGTTALVGMLARDERFRALRQWEASAPCPPPEVETEATDSRVDEARELAASLPPELAAMHLIDPLGPEEDFDIVGLGFRSGHFGGFWPLYQYPTWWLECDMASTFQYHARVLRLLASRRPPHHWLLKNPCHLFQLDAFARQYPDARFVMTHRDPRRAIPSLCSLEMLSFSAVTESVDAQRHGAFQLQFWSEGMRRALAARDRIGEHRFLDVFHNDLVHHPMREVERIYAFLRRDLDAGTATAIEAYVQRAATGPGHHEYTAEQFGLRSMELEESFAEYIKRFDVAS
jgi:Sulfotransferase family